MEKMSKKNDHHQIVVLDNEHSSIKSLVLTFWPDFFEHCLYLSQADSKLLAATSPRLLICEKSCFPEALTQYCDEVHVYSKDGPLELLNNVKITVNESLNSENFKILFVNRFNVANQQFTERSQLLEKIMQLNINLAKMVSSLDIQLESIKSMHKKMVPLRSASYKGINLKSKYLAGENTGGEFFDLIEKNKKLYFVCYSCNSYLASSNFIAHFEKLKNIDVITQSTIKHFIAELEEENNDLALKIKRDVQAELLLLEIDQVSFYFSAWQFGHFKFFQAEANLAHLSTLPVSVKKVDDAFFTGRLLPNTKYCIFSPGFTKNWNSYPIESTFSQFFKETSQLSTQEFLNQSVIYLKQFESEDFLKFDLSLIVFEVDKNVLYQI
jgi:hypothetical protein